MNIPSSDFPALLQGRVRFHGVQTQIEPKDTEALLAFCDVYMPRTDDWHAFESFFLCMADKVIKNIAAYGDDGNGNKESGMNRFQYWCAHIDPELIEEAVATLSKRPVEFVVFESDKPPSSAPKCSVCKGKIARGSLGIKKRIVKPSINPVHDKIPRWSIMTKTIVCSNPKCRSTLSIASKPTLDGISKSRRVEAEAMAEAAVA